MIGIPVRPITLLAAISILLFAGTVKGTLGFGAALIATPLLIQVLPPKFVLTILVLPIALTNVGLLVTDGVPWSFLHGQLMFFASLVLGAIVGALGLIVLPVNILYLALSGYIVGFLAFQQYESRIQSLANRRGFKAFSGAAAGLLGGSIGVAGPPIVTYMYAQTQNSPRSIFVTGMAAALVVPQLVRIPPLVAAGLFGPRELVLGTGAATIILTGLGLGARLRPYVPAQAFQYLVKGVLVIIAAKLAGDGLQ